MAATPTLSTTSPAIDYARRASAPRSSALGKYALLGAFGVLALTIGLRFLWTSGGVLPGSSGAVHIVKAVDLSITIDEDGELKPRESVYIKCEVEGEATLLFLVEESTRVKKGELLVELASDEVTERIETEEIEMRKIVSEMQSAREELDIQRNQNAADTRKAEIDLVVAELELKKYLQGDHEKSLKDVDIDIKQTEMEIVRKNDEIEKNDRLLAKGFVTPQKLEELRFELEKAQMTLAKHQLSREILMAYDHPKNEKQKSSAVDQAREELERVKKRAESKEKQAISKVQQFEELLSVRTRRLERMREQLSRCKIVAPSDGVVQYPEDGWRGDDEGLTVGAKVREGQTLLQLPDTSNLIVSTRIHEADRHRVLVGQRCIIKATSAPDRTFNGTISKIGKFADSTNRWLNPELKEHATEIQLDASDAALAPGDSAQIKIMIEDVPNVLAVPVQSVYARGAHNYVFVDRGGTARPVEVKLGRSTTNLIEVVSGLSSGDRVRMTADEALLATLPQPKAEQRKPRPNTAPEGAKSAAADSTTNDTAANTTEGETQAVADAAATAAPAADAKPEAPEKPANGSGQ